MTPRSYSLGSGSFTSSRYSKNRISYNDCLAYITMNENSVHEIYTFDKDYDRLTGIIRFPE